MTYAPKLGDQVRVTIEGEVKHTAYPGYLRVGVHLFHKDEPSIVSVEKIEPPVPAWQAGDVLTFLGEARLLGSDDVWRDSNGENQLVGATAYDHCHSVVVPIIRGGKLVDHRAEAG